MNLEKLIEEKFDKIKDELKKEGHSSTAIRGALSYAKILNRGCMISEKLGALTNLSTDPDQADEISRALIDELAAIISIAMNAYEKSHDFSDEESEFIMKRGIKINEEMTIFFNQQKEKDEKDPLESIDDLLKELEKLPKVKVIRI